MLHYWLLFYFQQVETIDKTEYHKIQTLLDNIPYRNVIFDDRLRQK